MLSLSANPTKLYSVTPFVTFKRTATWYSPQHGSPRLLKSPTDKVGIPSLVSIYQTRNERSEFLLPRTKNAVGIVYTEQHQHTWQSRRTHEVEPRHIVAAACRFNDKEFPPSAPLTPQSINKYSATIFGTCIHRCWHALCMERLSCAAAEWLWLLDVSILLIRQILSACCSNGLADGRVKRSC